MRQLEHTLQNLTSPKRSHTFWGLLVVLTVCFALLWLKHGHWLNAPNDRMLGASPDSFKNYMTSLWHVRHDSSAVHYRGMNYPYGEHVLFTDNQPILTAALQWWSQNVSDLTGHTVGVINISQIISVLLGCAVLFLLLRKLHIPAWYASLVTLGMVFLNPQWGRFDAHFGLSHTWIFPLLLLLLSNYEERYSRRYQSLQIGALVWVAAQFHFYYFGICALFLGLYTAYQLVRDPSLRNWRVRISHLFVMVVLPFALLNIWIHWADYASDRPANPYGFLTYIGEWEGVFLPYEDFPLFQWIDQHLVSIRRVNGEAKAYAGALSFLFTLWLLVSGFKMFDKSWEDAAYHRVHKRYLQGIFTAALLLLLFACGFPFAIKGLDWMVDYMGPLRQFRGLGRFTWAFFYVINVLAFYSLWNWSARFKGFQNGRAQWFRWVIALAPVLLLAWDAYTFQRLRPVMLMDNMENRAIAAPSPDHWINKVDFPNFRRFCPCRTTISVRKIFGWSPISGSLSETRLRALHTGLPDMGVNMSRTSCSQTVSSIQFVLQPCRMPSMLNELLDNRPIAVFVHGPAWDDVQRRYPHLVSRATPVYDSPDMKILSLSVTNVRDFVREQNAAVEQDRLSRSLVQRGKWQVSQPNGFVHYQSFDSLATARRIFQGKGAYSGEMGDTTWIWREALPKGQYVLSFWMYVNQDIGMNHELRIFENDPGDGREFQFRHEGMRFHLKTIVDNWGLFEIPFDVRNDNTRLSAFLYKEHIQQPFFLDELLLRSQDTDAYYREDFWVVRNNYWYKL
jgi:hypothetical protein